MAIVSSEEPADWRILGLKFKSLKFAKIEKHGFLKL